MTDRPEIWVGRDGGKRTHHACAVDRDGKAVFRQKLGNDQRSIEQLLVDQPDGVDTDHVLRAAGRAITFGPGRVVNTTTAGFRGEGKTDL
ncbi:IS110 family transposase [Nocardia beijingensis]|uniref:IS110 family transposase n=1 Tax=Nocardia beijingensis TaxID=95162 RepID=UPI002B4B0937|nr:transposase [Nocardia beijingensis]